MTVSSSVPATIEIRRSRLVGGALVVAAAAAGLTWALLAFAFDTGSTSGVSRATDGTPVGVIQQAVQYGRGLSNVGLPSSAAQQAVQYGRGLSNVGLPSSAAQQAVQYGRGLSNVGVPSTAVQQAEQYGRGLSFAGSGR
jgi:hypothetical protein